MPTPTDVANLALDAAGVDYTLGDIEDNVREAQVCARAYKHCLGSLLRAAHWTFARKQTPMILLAAANPASIASLNPPQKTIFPWTYPMGYVYAYPNDCVRAIYVPWQANPYIVGSPAGNIVPTEPSLPINSAQSPYMTGYFRPARFLIQRDINFPPLPGENWNDVQGVSPMGQTVILCNVPNAVLTYTSLVLYPSEWDPSFHDAFVDYLAAEIVLPLSKDKKFGLTLRRSLMADAEKKVSEARAQSANEVTNINSSFPDWINVRNSGRGGHGYGMDGGGGGEIGGYWGGCDSFGSLGGAVF